MFGGFPGIDYLMNLFFFVNEPQRMFYLIINKCWEFVRALGFWTSQRGEFHKTSER
jgi:hypothetical protein